MSRSKRQEKERRDVIIVILLTVLCAILFGLGSTISFETGAFRLAGLFPESSKATVMPTLESKPPATSTLRQFSSPSPSSDERKSRQAGSSFGIGFSQLIDAFTSEGFTFEEEFASAQIREVNGKSANAMAALKIVGHGETIATIQMVIHYQRNDQEELKKNLGYMVKSIKLAIPHWKDAVIWFYGSVAELAKKQADPRESSVLLDKISIHLKLTTLPDLLFLTCEAAAP